MIPIMNDKLYGKEGFLYILANQSYPGLLKVGVTRLHPLQRMDQLSAASGVPTPFKLKYYRDFDDVFKAETLIHQMLAEYRVNESREFFRLGLDEVIKHIEKLVHREWNLKSRGVVDRDEDQQDVKQRLEKETPTPFADLYASFEPSDDPNLNEDEERQCRELEKSLATR